MPKVDTLGDFFVVGGPVQPDRPCYVERAADAELARGIAEQRFCYVLSARSTGKSSLMARAIRSLRREKQLAAVVDLNQIGARGDSSDAARWYYSIAYRIVRELRLKVELQTWWQERSALSGEQRLAEFFWEIVLTNTSAPVTVFIDEIERALDLPFAQDLFATIQACYARRVSEPDYSRLNFVVLGVASSSALSPDASLSPFIHGLSIEPGDFTLEQSLELAAGFRPEGDDPREVLERIHDWAGGQPYLTQKIARAVARKGGRAQDVARVVREQLLAPGAAQKEPYLNHIRAVLTAPGARSRQSLVLLGKIARGVPVADEPSSPPRELLKLSGIVCVGEDGLLRYRNRILREVFDDRWISTARPFDWRGAGAIAALIAVVAVVAVWYSQYLPRPYIDTLSVVTEDFAVAEEAYVRLRRLPGFASTADRLLAEAMARRSRGADSHAEMMAADKVLRSLPEQAGLADQLAADYWLRRAEQARSAERRDEALLFTMQALPGRDAEVRRLAAELIGDDYHRLVCTFRFAGPVLRWAVDWAEGSLAVVDRAHRVQRLPLGLERRADEADAAATGMAGRIAALHHVPVRRELGVEETGSAGAFRLHLRVQHPRADDLFLMLSAPSGAMARIALSQQSPEQELYSFRASGASPLASLADEARQGVWRVTVIDREAGAVGVLLRWGLQFSETGKEWRDAPERGIAIPDPGRTEQVHVEISDDGHLAAAWPAREGALGAMAIWNLLEGRLLHDLDMRAEPDHVAFSADAARLLVQSDDVLGIWDVRQGVSVGSIQTQTEFVLPPALSVDGDFVAIAEHIEGARPLFSLVRLQDAAVVASAEGIASAGGWVLGPEARYAAVLERSPRLVSIIDPRRGELLRELRHTRNVRRLIPVPAGDWLLSVDEAGEVRAWALPVDDRAAQPERGWRLGTTIDPASVSVSADGVMVAFEGDYGHIVVQDIAGELSPVHLRIDRSGRFIDTALSPDGRALVTDNGGALSVWRLEPRELGGAQRELSALAIDRRGAVAALGFHGGHVRVRSAGQLELDRKHAETVDYIGHRGTVTSLDIDAARGKIASGDEHGAVRVWDLATVAPARHYMRHPEGPVNAVAISSDGRWIASAAEYSARVWRASEGTLSSELPVNGTALAVAFAPDSSLWAVGDSAGNVFFGTPDGEAQLGSVRAQGPVRAMAFAEAGDLIASGDETGNIELWRAAEQAPVGQRHAFAHPVRWIGFAEADGRLVIQTDHWIHLAEIRNGILNVIGSRLLDAGVAAGAALVESDARRVRLVGGLGAGRLAIQDLSFDAPGAEPLEPDSPLLDRDWGAVLGLRIDDEGQVQPVWR